MPLDKSRDSLSKACRNNSWSAWISCRLGFLAAAIAAAEDDWYKPSAFPPEPKACGWLPPEELCFCGAIAAPHPCPRPSQKKKMAKVAVQMWSVEQQKRKERFTGPLSLSKQKSCTNHLVRRSTVDCPFQSAVWKFRSSVFDSSEATVRWFRIGVGLPATELGEQAWNARNETAASGKLTRLASLTG